MTEQLAPQTDTTINTNNTEKSSLLKQDTTKEEQQYGSIPSTSISSTSPSSSASSDSGSSQSGKDDDNSDIESRSLQELSQSLLQCDGDEDVRMVIKQTLDLSLHQFHKDHPDSNGLLKDGFGGGSPTRTDGYSKGHEEEDAMEHGGGSSYQKIPSSQTIPISNMSGLLTSKSRVKRVDSDEMQQSIIRKICAMTIMAIFGIMSFFVLGNLLVGPPAQAVGPYQLVELQEGNDFFSQYTFYNGLDSEGSKGYVNYVSQQEAFDLNIANVTHEPIPTTSVHGSSNNHDDNTEPFVYMSTSPTPEGPRNSIRLEGLKRYNRGLFIIDIRHMPAGCGSWPAFWLTDEANWPVNGEFDIVEGVNTQSVVKTALHSTQVCTMDDIPLGVKTGVWDTAQGVPKKNGELDMTKREARDCFVYDPHQWLNQGCVAMSERDDTLGVPLNNNGGGVFVLEWDPVNRHIKSWVFSPHKDVPDNLRESMDTASLEPHMRVRPDPTKWDLPYAYFSIGEGTNCNANHFKNMHLVFNMALCGTVAGNRFFLDCPELNEKYGSCENYIDADTPAMQELYWKIRGVYVYEREWENTWV